MSIAGKKILEGLEEALRFTRGEETAARVLGMYFRGPLKGTKSTEDLANKLSEIGVRVILLPWCPIAERGRPSADAIQAMGDENQQAHSA